jgi:hypothetical protein
MCCIMTMLYYLFRLQTPLVPSVHAPLPKASNAQPVVTGASGQQAAAQAVKAAAAGAGGKTAAVTVGGPVAGATGVVA